MKITTRKIVIIPEFGGIRLYHPQHGKKGILRKIWHSFNENFFYKSYDKKAFGFIPTFIRLPLIVNQLVIDSIPKYTGGGVNGFGETIKVRPVIVNEKSLRHCKDAAETKEFKIRNFTYNGMGSTELEGYANYVGISMVKNSDPGCWTVQCSDGKTRHIPGFYIEGCQINEFVDKSTQYTIFGPASAS